MKKFTTFVALTATIVFGAGNALAVCGDSTVDPNPGGGPCTIAEGCEQCDDGANGDDTDGCSDTCRFTCNFNTAGKAKGSKQDMVRAMAECPSTQTSINSSPGPNGDTSTAPTCTPVTPKATGSDDPTDYLFSEKKGGCSLKIKHKPLKDCSAAKDPDGAPLGVSNTDPCAELSLDLKCKGIVQADGSTPINPTSDLGWSLFTLTRATTLDSNIGAGTVVDFPVAFSVPGTAMDGKGGIKLSVTSTQALFSIFGADTALSECSSLETVEIGLLAPGGRPFAKPGTSSRPKDSVGLGGAG